MAEHSSSDFVCIVPAAGVGQRMQADRPKQYLPFAGRTLIECTLEKLLSHPKLSRLVVAVAENDTYWPKLPLCNDPRVTTVIGGSERAESVLAGLKALEGTVDEDTRVFVHDAARPCISHREIDTLCEPFGDAAGFVLGIPVRDTLKQTSDADVVSHTVSREGMWHAQTPQVFPYALLKTFIEQALAAGQTITDEASAVEYAGHKVRLRQGKQTNIKVTVPEDILLAEIFWWQSV